MFVPRSMARLNAASRPALRHVNTTSSVTFPAAALRPQLRSQLCTLSRRPQHAVAKPLALQLLRTSFSDKRGPMDTIDTKAEQAVGKAKLPSSPDVSSTSSIHPVMGEVGVEESGEKDQEMLSGVKSDMQTIRETFSLAEVPRQAYWIGMAGVLPYVGTSLATVYCAWEINHAHATGLGFLMNEKTAELYLHILEPLQVGYGATIISFLGAIHWGLEFAKFGGEHGYSRYSIGVVSTALAWPTILFPVEYALISQFLIFNFLYYTDSRATKRGWAPSWYAVYRFVLTFIVGASIVASLVGRGQIVDHIGRPSGPAERVKELMSYQLEESHTEEEVRAKFLAEKEESDDEEEGEGESEDEE